MSAPDESDLERLASRLAMVVSDGGEAANAGRAVGQLARRLGLSGGDLKEIFLAGAMAGARRGIDTASAPPADAGALARENATLRRSVAVAEGTARQAERERDAARVKVQTLTTELARRRAADRLTRIAGGGVLALAAVSALLFFATPSGRPRAPDPPMPADAGPQARIGVVRPTGASLHGQPDPASPVVGTLEGGKRVAVRRLLWNALVQWGEVEIDGRRGYVQTTELDLT